MYGAAWLDCAYQDLNENNKNEKNNKKKKKSMTGKGEGLLPFERIRVAM